MKKAFTLAEVLITLTIIGVIAAITIPTLSRKWSDHADIQKVKEAYSILSNAWTMALKENGPIFDWDWPGGPITARTYISEDKSNFLAKEIYKYMKLEKYCGSATCFSMVYNYKSFNNFDTGSSGRTDNGVYGKAILANGMYMAISSQRFDSDGNAYDTFVRVDINGKKGPNKYGYDVFFFVLRKNNVLYLDDRRFCKLGNTAASSYTYVDGNDCSRWILLKGNMDYKYRDVSSEW